jgi:hypothetical protein
VRREAEGRGEPPLLKNAGPVLVLARSGAVVHAVAEHGGVGRAGREQQQQQQQVQQLQGRSHRVGAEARRHRGYAWWSRRAKRRRGAAGGQSTRGGDRTRSGWVWWSARARGVARKSRAVRFNARAVCRNGSYCCARRPTCEPTSLSFALFLTKESGQDGERPCQSIRHFPNETFSH